MSPEVKSSMRATAVFLCGYWCAVVVDGMAFWPSLGVLSVFCLIAAVVDTAMEAKP